MGAPHFYRPRGRILYGPFVNWGGQGFAINYRHIYHAGNFADVLKHLGLVAVLDHLGHKDKPVTLIDAFAGCGLYGLDDPRALRTNEALTGIAAIEHALASPTATPLLALYRAVLGDANRGHDGRLRYYPGSPVFMAHFLKEHDRLLVNEKHPDEHDRLATILPRSRAIRISAQDAYMFLRASLPPRPDRGFALIDPPFERSDEFAVLCQQMAEWHKRWAHGIYGIWFPIKDHLPWRSVIDTARSLPWRSRAWIRVDRDPVPETGLGGCGFLVLNPPWQWRETMCTALSMLQSAGWDVRFSAEILDE